MITKKVLLVGNFGVGKTSLISRFVLNEFSEDYISTIGVRVSKKVVQLDNELVTLLIWDVAGTKWNEKIPTSYFLGASAAMFVFDLSREETYSNIRTNLDQIKELSKLDKFTVVGNKMDLITDEQLEKIKDQIEIKIDFETSAKEGLNVEQAFKILTEQAIK